MLIASWHFCQIKPDASFKNFMFSSLSYLHNTPGKHKGGGNTQQTLNSTSLCHLLSTKRKERLNSLAYLIWRQNLSLSGEYANNYDQEYSVASFSYSPVEILPLYI